MRLLKHTALGLAALAIAAAPALAQGVAIPAHPNELKFEPLEFEPPDREEHRREIAGGVPVYMAPSSEFPLLQVTFTFKGGAYLDPEDKAGLASMTGSLIRRGGTESVSASELDERFDFLAANVSTGSGSTQSNATINCLASNFDEAFSLFMDMLRNPGFQEDRVEIYRDEAIERMKQRNDDAGPILSRQWRRLLYGEDHFLGRVSTEASIESITIDDLRAFHQKVFQPGNLIIGVTGDFEPSEMASRLEKALAGWERGTTMPDPPAPDENFEPGVYYVEKDIPQGRVHIGQRGVQRDHPDYFPLLVMNDILGGGGFTSRIMNRVRSDEGLAYGAGSSMRMPPHYPGEFRAVFQSKSRTVALATKIVLEEIERIQSNPVSEEELETARNSFIETFPRRFESKAGMINVFINDEWTDRPEDYWKNYRDNIRSVSSEDVQRVAKTHLDPDAMAILVVGDWEDIYPGDLDGRARMSDFFDGQATELPLRDPLTQKPMQSEED